MRSARCSVTNHVFHSGLADRLQDRLTDSSTLLWSVGILGFDCSSRIPHSKAKDLVINLGSSFPISFAEMQFIDAFNLILSILGTYGLVVSLRLLLPRNVVPRVSIALEEAESRLHDAEAIHAVSNVNQYRIDLAMYEDVLYSAALSHLTTDTALASNSWACVGRAIALLVFFNSLDLFFCAV